MRSGRAGGYLVLRRAQSTELGIRTPCDAAARPDIALLVRRVEPNGLRSRDRRLVVTDGAGAIVGYAQARLDEPTVVESWGVVQPTLRGRGIGSSSVASSVQ